MNFPKVERNRLRSPYLLVSRSSPLVLGALVLGALSFSMPAHAEESLTGRFTLGWRFVDIGGTENKYRQHYNYGEGARVFGIDLDFRPDSRFADLLEVRASNLGGDPYESIDLEIRRFGSYRFAFGRRVTETFYEDILLPDALVNPRLSNGGDFHHFDFQRVRDFAHLDLQLGPRSRLDARIDRYSKRGESTTTFAISRDEFELDQPIDEQLDQISVAFSRQWNRANLLVQETVREHDRARELFLPGRSEGENPGPAILDFYFLDEPIDSSAIQHRMVLNTKPHRDLALTFSLLIDELELDSLPSEEGSGTAFNGAPLEIEADGRSGVERDVALLQAEATWWLGPRVALTLDLAHRELDQDGSLFFDGDLSETAWQIETTGAELAVEFQASEDVTLSAGLLSESRDVDHLAEIGDASETVSTDQLGFRAAASWTPRSDLRLQVSVESSTIDDPYTLASPTDRERLRVEARWNRPTGWFLGAQYQRQDIENTNSLWQSDYDWFDVRAGYRSEVVRFTVGASILDTERSVDQQVMTSGFGGGAVFLFPVFFTSELDFLHASADWAAHPRLRLGSSVRLYENAGDFATKRDDLSVWAETTFSESYLLRLGLRSIDYEEPRFGLNDYDAELVELAFGYRF